MTWRGDLTPVQAHALIDRALWGPDSTKRKGAHKAIDAAASHGGKITLVISGHRCNTANMYTGAQTIAPIAALRVRDVRASLSQLEIKLVKVDDEGRDPG